MSEFTLLRENNRGARICAIVLTRNEAQHLDRCLQSIRGVVSRIVLIDCGSTDATLEIAHAHGAEVFINRWENYATQFNWALDNCNIKEDWCLRIDADEYLSRELQKCIKERICRECVPFGINGFTMRRIMIFMDRPMKWGGIGHLYMLRIFRTGQARCEQRWMDEHIVLECGAVNTIDGVLIDHNLNNIGWWINKHNAYATREAIDLLNIRHKFLPKVKIYGIDQRSQAGFKRWIKEKIYSRLPIGIRSVAYFCWRFFIKLGFMDGREGMVFHFLQGFWYRLLVDLKVSEIEKKASANNLTIPAVIEAEYGYKIANDDI